MDTSTQSSNGGSIGPTGNPQQPGYSNDSLQQSGSGVQVPGQDGFSLNSSGPSSEIKITDGSGNALSAQADTKVASNNTSFYLISGLILALIIICTIALIKKQGTGHVERRK